MFTKRFRRLGVDTMQIIELDTQEVAAFSLLGSKKPIGLEYRELYAIGRIGISFQEWQEPRKKSTSR